MSISANPPILVGAYAALPKDAHQQQDFYAGLLQRGVTGLEIPDHHVVGVPSNQFDSFVKTLRMGFTRSVITAIPSTMRRQGPNPGEGLASVQEDKRHAALEFIGEICVAADRINELTGERSIAGILIHSAPTAAADPDAFKRSLNELQVSAERHSADLIIEHCDAHCDQVAGEKRFLELDQEVAAARNSGMQITINWGRSVVESHDPTKPRQQIEQLAGAGLLAGIAFSGASSSENQYGGAWADAHLPLDTDEPTSLMTAQHVKECLQAAAGTELYRAAEVQVPQEASVARRLEIVGSVLNLFS